MNNSLRLVLAFVLVLNISHVLSTRLNLGHGGLRRNQGDEEIRAEWERFKVSHNVRLAANEEEHRFNVFKENYKLIQEFNSDETRSFNTSINKFSSLTHEEYVRMRLGLRSFQRAHEPSEEFNDVPILQSDHLPSSFSWLSRDVVTDVKDQGNCGSCWAFATTGIIETLYAVKYGRKVRFSEQQLVDCTYNQSQFLNYGCQGGWPENALQYVQSIGLVESSSYPYRARENSYCYSQHYPMKIRISSYHNLPERNEYVLKKVVYHYGPVAVGVDASPWTFEHYSGGIYDDYRCSEYNLNHAMLLVGYGTENGKDYWLIKNSWGTSWGEDGYMKLARNSNNMCGIASMATFGYM